MIVIHHNKDLDGFTSGAICKLKYPDATLIGWDYSDEIPDFEQFKGEEVIMIDITFPLNRLQDLGKTCKLTVIDHHISFSKQVDELIYTDNTINFEYVYKDRVAACEIGWEYLFPDEPIPYAITLIGRYDTWRQEEGDWTEETLPFKYYMYGSCNSAESFPIYLIKKEFDFINLETFVKQGVVIGKSIMKYQETMDEAIAKKNAFEKEVYEGFYGLCLSYYPFSSETLKSVYIEGLHDIMIGFAYTGSKWGVSLRSTSQSGVDVSLIARARGGGGHKNAAGFEVDNFEDIFK